MPTTAAESRRQSRTILCGATATAALATTLIHHAASNLLLFTAPSQPKQQVLQQGTGFVSQGRMGNLDPIASPNALVQPGWAAAAANALLVAAVAAAVCRRSTACMAKRNTSTRPETA